MCGRCRQVFDAFQSLTRIEEGATSQKDVAPPVGDFSLEQESATEDHALVEDSSTSDLVPHAPAPTIDPDPVQLENAARANEGPSEVQQHDVSPEPSVDLPDPPPLVATAPSATISPGLILDPENPLLTTPPPQYRPTPKSSHRWVVAAVLLGVALILQLAYAYRAQVAQQFPPTRPLLSAACDWAGCSIPRGRDESAIRIEASDLVEAPGRNGRIMLTATLVNRGAYSQEYPALELRLTDSGNQVVLSRVFQPSEYLGRNPGKEESIAQGAEVFVNMQVELLSKPPASGYGVRAFYP